MPIQTLQFQPGINKESTQYSAGAGWYDGNRVRFRKGYPEAIGGWVKYSDEPFKGVARSINDWGTRIGGQYVGVGTDMKFYVEQGGAYNDITPIRKTTTGAATFSATSGSSLITVTDAGHGAVLGDFVSYLSAVSLGGTILAGVINQEHRVVEVVDGDNYVIDVAVQANASDTGDGGASTVAAYQINVGLNFYTSSTGYGTDGYGANSWGGSATLSSSNQLRTYSQDAFGDDLIFCVRNGGVYFWDESLGLTTRGVAISDLAGASNAPTVALQVMVSEVDRHVVCFGTNPIGSSAIDPLLVRWSDQESVTDWTPRATNSAGGQVLPTGTRIIGAVKTRQEILIFTDGGIVSMRFTGSPFVFSFAVVAEGVTICSPKAFAVAGDEVYFMDRDAFYVYRGAVQRLPCTVHEYVFGGLSQSQIFKVFGSFNPDFSEVTFFYPRGSATAEIDSYVSYNYLEQAWSIGSMARGAMYNPSVQDKLIGSSADLDNLETQYLYTHETGFDADGEPLGAYIESGDFQVGEGDKFSFVSRLLPDFQFNGNMSSAEVTVTFKGRNFPLEDLQTLYTTTVTPSSTQNHVRLRRREMVVRFDGPESGYGWRIGSPRIAIRTDGRR